MQISQTGLYDHWSKIFTFQISDFRSVALTKFISSRLSYKTRIFDIGCGTGVQAYLLQKMGYSVVGIDSSIEMLDMAEKFCQQRNTSIDFYHIPLELLSKLESKPMQVICLDVLEHIEEDSIALDSIYYLLADEGKLIISVPVHQNLYSSKDFALGHYRRYSKDELVQKLEATGFVIDELQYWNVIGYVIQLINVKFFNKSVNESFRYKRNWVSSLKQWLLSKWFYSMENNFKFPTGLTLFVVARKRN